MNRDVRAALLGGLAATFVVAASLAPKLAGQQDEVTVRSASSGVVEETTTSSQASSTTTTTESTTTTTAPPVSTTSTADLSARVGGLEERVTRLESTTTTTAPAAPEVTFYFEGTTGLGPEAAAEPYDGTWKVVFRTTRVEPGLRVRFMAQTRNGPAEFVAAFSDTRPMYAQSAIARLDASLFDLPDEPPAQSGNPVVFQRIVAVEWDGGSIVL